MSRGGEGAGGRRWEYYNPGARVTNVEICHRPTGIRSKVTDSASGERFYQSNADRA
jgi:hypothetical protein